MQLRVGFEMTYQCAHPTPMMLALSIHSSRAVDLLRPDRLVTDPAVPTTSYLDLFGKQCSRLVAPQGRFVLSSDAVVNDSGAADVMAPSAVQTAVEDLPAPALTYLLGSRYCETELLCDIAWQQLAIRTYRHRLNHGQFDVATVAQHGGNDLALTARHRVAEAFSLSLNLRPFGWPVGRIENHPSQIRHKPIL
jgi:hypothetical protein